MIQIEGLVKTYGQKEILKGIDLQVETGKVFGFIGHNGAGKTTLMRCLLGLTPFQAGTIMLEGQPVSFGKPLPVEVGYLPDVPALYAFQTAREYLTLCNALHPKPQPTSRIDEMLEIVGLQGVTTRIGGFSRGMKQRLGFAQGLLNRPQLFICDEPTSALDPEGRSDMLQLMQDIRNDTTVFFSTHILSDVERICDDVACIHQGKVLFQQPIAHLLQQQQTGIQLTFATDEDAKLALQLINQTGVPIHSATVELPEWKPEMKQQILQASSSGQLDLIAMQPIERTLEDVVKEAIQ